MGRLPLDRNAYAAALLCALALACACLGSGGSSVSGAAVSASPRADFEEAVQPSDLLFPADGPSMTLARDLAVAHWGGAACGGQVAIGWSLLEDGTNATASWRNPTDAWNNAAANFDCRIDFNVRAEFDWTKLCSVMAHEVGHLLGRQHVADPRDLMAPFYSGPTAECEQSADPAHPVAAPRADVVAADEVVETVASAARPAATHRRTQARHRSARCRTGRRALARRHGKVKRLRCHVPHAARRAAR
ncbi:MAG TPA: matrixin family metalloprotease [Solirubrobacteraceae bacterium]